MAQKTLVLHTTAQTTLIYEVPDSFEEKFDKSLYGSSQWIPIPTTTETPIYVNRTHIVSYQFLTREELTEGVEDEETTVSSSYVGRN